MPTLTVSILYCLISLNRRRGFRNVTKLYANGKAFAALTTAGRVGVWGKASDGGELPEDKLSTLASGVVSNYRADRVFAALKSDGSLVAWGTSAYLTTVGNCQ